MRQKKIIFFELNEVPFKIFDYFVEKLPNSNIAKLRSKARSYETFSQDSGHLSPWITWPTLHRGVTNDLHGISDFGMDLTHVNKDFPPIWDLLARAGVKVGVFGSLNSYPLPDNVTDYAFYVPDTFAAGPECFPRDLEAFQDFNLKMAGTSVRDVNSKLALKEASRFVMSAPGLGIRGRTLQKLSAQLLMERIDRKRLVRRRTSQVQIAFDFYMAALRRQSPDISFFFTNHVASSMHRYWPALFPADYEDLNYDNQWIDAWSGEIPFAMGEADYQLGQLMSFAERNDDHVLVVGSSMGQAAVQGRMKIDRTVIVTDLSRLMQTLGLQSDDWDKRPAMAPKYTVYVREAVADAFTQRLASLDVCGRRFKVEPLGESVFSISLFCPNAKVLEVSLDGAAIDPKSVGLKNLHLQDAAGSNAYHIPEGMLLVYDPKEPAAPSATSSGISTTEIAPSIMRNFMVDRPGHMQAALEL